MDVQHCMHTSVSQQFHLLFSRSIPMRIWYLFSLGYNLFMIQNSTETMLRMIIRHRDQQRDKVKRLFNTFGNSVQQKVYMYEDSDSNMNSLDGIKKFGQNHQLTKRAFPFTLDGPSIDCTLSNC
ncbi:hypothetical protein L1987_78553 [Smallanthus sonchifolius]|uniref:Uncharacterized protein n=1 Tax=Smallanthus sonchifolius TaxID=185202 RepID=A0ACB8ZCT7_9ASTR|nr:hypothetical protein L1987_78553 [Smallanthus sonchifolius]